MAIRDFLGRFDGEFLGYLVAFGVVAITFLFYFNRLIALVLFTLIRTYTWFFYRVHVKCQALQFSLLGGRIFLRGLSYHGDNETVLVHQVYITWQYWYRRVEHVNVDTNNQKEDESGSTSGSLEEKSDSLPSDKETGALPPQRDGKCRISAQIRGVEWFVYNRRPAYDQIIASAAQTVYTRSQELDARSNEGGGTAPNLADGDVAEGAKILKSFNFDRGSYEQYLEKPKPEPPAFLSLLPVYVDCNKIAMVLGNKHTRSVLVARAERAKGRINAHASGPLDSYRQSFEFEITKPVIQFVPNEDYVEPLLTAGARLNGGSDEPQRPAKSERNAHKHKISRHRARHALSKLLPQFRRSVESFDRRSGSLRKGSSSFQLDSGPTDLPPWIGLTRYLDEEEEDKLEHDRWQTIEYGEAHTIAELSTISMTFFWDIPGTVTSVEKSTTAGHRAAADGDINGAPPPSYGVELRLGEGIVQYGPWADRQRIDFMTVFFPSAYMDTLPALPLRPGQNRIATVFKILIVLDDKIELKLLTREPSKDWKFRGVGQPKAVGGKRRGRSKLSSGTKPFKISSDPHERPAGWVSVFIAANTAVSYDMDMVPRRSGFRNTLKLDVVSPEIQTSVNSDILLRSSSMSVSADISNPPAWSQSRIWKFNIFAREADLFMLREHAFLIQDLVEDFTVGPAPEFYTFIPFTYELRLEFDGLKIHLNANEANIVDKPSDITENILLSLQPRRLVANVIIPADQLNPVTNKISFEGELEDTKFRVLTPTWNTYRTFSQDDILGSFPQIIAKGSYNYFAETSTANTDCLLMDIHGVRPEMSLYGFLIRYFLNFQENYFGKDVHFQTIAEYQGLLDKPGRKHAADNDHKPTKAGSDLDVILSITTENPTILLPSSLYASQNCVKITLQTGHADLRFTNYYMDLQTALSPLSVSLMVYDSLVFDKAQPKDAGVKAFIDGATITGHRLFGVPPEEPTYACNWDFEVGDITGESSMELLTALVTGIQAFIYGLDDKENALPSQEELPVNDVTFLRAVIRPIRLWLLVEDVAFLCELASSRVEFNDWSSRRFSERLVLVIPKIVLAVVSRDATNNIPENTVAGALTYGYLQTSVDFRMLQSKANFRDARRQQQEHIRLHDTRTSRTPWLIRDPISLSSSQYPARLAKLQPPASQFPPVPEPLKLNLKRPTTSLRTKSSGSGRSLRNPNSFLLQVDPVEHVPSNPGSEEKAHLDATNQRPKPWTRFDATKLDRRDTSKGIVRGHAATLTSTFSHPRFPFHQIRPDDRDVPSISIVGTKLRQRAGSDVTIDEMPIEDDGIAHVSLMINLESGLRAMCTPPALDGVNRLLAGVKDTRPEMMIDSLQLDSLGEVISDKKSEEAPKSIQIRLELPGAAIRFRHQHFEDIVGQDARQVYEVALHDLVAFTRLGAHRPAPLGKMPSSAHVSLTKLEIEAKRTTHGDVSDARVIGVLSDLTCWIHDAEEVAGELQFKALEVASLNRRIEHLAAIVNDAGSLADRLGSTFKATLNGQKGRVQYLVYYLLTTGQHVVDPSILSSSSFISRSSGGHVRASDDWKMIMRLRWILKCMDHASLALLAKTCSRDVVPIPEDAQAQVLSCFQNWRPWELGHIRNCALMRTLYGNAVPVEIEAVQEFTKPIRLSFVSGVISVSVDPARKGNRILSKGLGVVVDSLLEVADAPMNNQQTTGLAGRKTSIEIFCDNFLVEMKLELLDAVEGIFTHVKRLESSQPPPQPILPRKTMSHFSKQEFHLILLVKKGDLCLRTKHLKTTLQSDYLNGSLLATKFTPETVSAALLLASKSSSIKARAQSRLLMNISSVRPSLFVHLSQSDFDSKSLSIWNVGGNCRKISVDANENALSMLAIADQVIGEEFVYMQSFLHRIKKADNTAPTDVPVKSAGAHLLHVTLDLEFYQITAIIFSSLRYRIEGQGARSRLRPRSEDLINYGFDFDIRQHVHSMYNDDAGNDLEIGRLALPPILGNINLVQSKEVMELGVNLHMSTIHVDASDIHDVFSTLSRTELARFARDIARDIGIVKANYQVVVSSLANVESPQATQTAAKVIKEKSLKYSAKGNLDGISIIAHSSKSLKTFAELNVDSGPISFGITNRSTKSGGALPDIDLRLNRIRITLESLEDDRRVPCGNVTVAFSVLGRSVMSDGVLLRSYMAEIDRFGVDIYTETASMIVDILGYIQQRFKHFNMKDELHTFRAKRRQRTKSQVQVSSLQLKEQTTDDDVPVALFEAIISFELRQLSIAWRVSSMEISSPISEPEDLIFSIDKIDLRTKKGNSARLEIKNLQLQMVKTSQVSNVRSNNSALLPEVVFKIAYLSTSKDRRLAFQALGQKLDLRITSQFILPLANVQRSIAIATQDLRKVLADWNETLVTSDSEQQSVLGSKKLTSLIVDADFAGAEVFIEGRNASDRLKSRGNRMSQHGRLGQYEDRNSTTLRSPGLAFRIEYQDVKTLGRSLNAEIKVAASKNELRPMFVPLVLEVISSVKELVSQDSQAQKASEPVQDSASSKETMDAVTDATAILGDCKLNMGLRICEQSFSLTCEPIAKVTATARFEDIYVTVSTVQPPDGERFFAVSSRITGFETTVRHIYSREPTGRFEVRSIDLSLMNSEHVSGLKGISSILNISPTTVFLNVKQLQDFLTFREIWYPVEIRPVPQAPAPSTDQTIGGVQRYYQATATNAFSWNAAINMQSLDIKLDLGQAVGRFSFSISNLWIMSRKDSAAEQNLCLGFDTIGAKSEGRMSGSIELRDMRLRTNIIWQNDPGYHRTPLVQASLAFADLRARAAFDYQTFAVADFQSLRFLLYNTSGRVGDHLICTVDGDKIHAYCTANIASQSVALYQAVDRLIQEKLAAFEISLKQMEKFQRQKAAAGLGLSLSQELPPAIAALANTELTPVRLQVNVVVSLNALKVGVYHRAFTDNQIFKLEALDALARFAVNIQNEKTHTLLTVILGQLRVALSNVNREQRSKSRGEVSIEDVVRDSVASRGGTILKVPRVVATMQTWQPVRTKQVEYVFSSTFEGKVEVGWNYARISFIRTMWDTHSKALVQRLGKPLPQSALQITSTPRPDALDEEGDASAKDMDKPPKELITAVVNVPQSKYTYIAREPPIIQTPQLRDMGEATPPLEWIGLQRDKLPNLTHQIVIVPLLEFAKEVEDAYGKILGAI